MIAGGHRRKTKGIFITLGTVVVLLAAALQVGWIVVNWRIGVMLVLGILFFACIITGVVLNTIFLVREVRRNEQQDAFINAVTHELKTPVASMRLYLQTLQSRQIDDAKRAEFYDIMLRDSDRLMGTIDQVLRAGQTSSQRKLERTEIDLRELVRDCLTLARTRHHLPEDALTYRERLPPGQASTVVGDVEELKAAVSNLIDNAVKYSGAQVRVLVELAATAAGRLAVRVKDQGMGIPNGELKRIFKRFYRAPNVSATRVKGTGLGLFIVRSVAQKHGGRAFAESAGAGQGSTFTLQLPAATLQLPGAPRR